MRGGHGEQLRHQRVEAIARVRRQLRVARRALDARQRCRERVGIGESRARAGARCRSGVSAGSSQSVVNVASAAPVARPSSPSVCANVTDTVARCRASADSNAAGAAVHRFGEQRALGRVLRQLVRLPVVAILQPVLDVAQEHVGVGERADRGGRQQPARAEHRERRQRAADAQVLLASAADDLQRLRDELDLADAAVAQLHVLRVVAARALVADLPVDVAQALVRVVVEVLAVDERRDQRDEVVVARAGDRARLQPRVALPRAALRDEVVLEARERRRQRPAVAVRAAAACRRGTRSRRPSTSFSVAMTRRPSRSKYSRFEIGARTGGVALLGVHEHEVDVGRHVELGAAQLAHADDDQRLLGARFGADRRAVRGRRAPPRGTSWRRRARRRPGAVCAAQTSGSAARPVRSRTIVCRNTRRRSARSDRPSAAASAGAASEAPRRRPLERARDGGVDHRGQFRLGGKRPLGIAAERERAGEVHGGIGRESGAPAPPGPPGSFGYNRGSGRPHYACRADTALHSLAPSLAIRLLRFAGTAIMALVATFCIALLAIRYVVFPAIDDYREPIAQRLAAELGQPVTIDAIAGGWDGWNPKLTITGLAIRDRAQPGRRARAAAAAGGRGRRVDVGAGARPAAQGAHDRAARSSRCAATSRGGCTSRASRSIRTRRKPIPGSRTGCCGSGRSSSTTRC